VWGKGRKKERAGEGKEGGRGEGKTRSSGGGGMEGRGEKGIGETMKEARKGGVGDG